MQKIVDMMYDNNGLNMSLGLTDDESLLDEFIRNRLDDETMGKYLTLQDLLMSSRCDGEYRAYEKGFNDAIRLIKELYKI